MYDRMTYSTHTFDFLASFRVENIWKHKHEATAVEHMIFPLACHAVRYLSDYMYIYIYLTEESLLQQLSKVESELFIIPSCPSSWLTLVIEHGAKSGSPWCFSLLWAVVGVSPLHSGMGFELSRMDWINMVSSYETVNKNKNSII